MWIFQFIIKRSVNVDYETRTTTEGSPRSCLSGYVYQSLMAGVVTAEQTAAGSSALLDEVVVTGTRTPHSLKDTPVETVLLNQQDIQQRMPRTLLMC